MSIKEIPAKMLPVIQKLRLYLPLLCIITIAGAYGFLVWQINSLAAREPSDEVITETLQGVKRPKIDQNAVSKIQQLQETNVEVKALFDQARNNPFQ